MHEKSLSKRAIVVVVALLFLACVDARTMGDAMIEGGEVLRDATRSDAAAQATPCTQWEISTWRAPTGCVSAGSCMVPAGWEPAFAQYGDWSGPIALRRCTAN
jgi:hypothetical protein